MKRSASTFYEIEDIEINYQNFYVQLGLAMAVAVEKSGFLNRLALIALRFCGASDRLLLLCFMIPTAFYSLWVNDTELTVMMVKTVQLVLAKMDINQGDHHGSKITSNYGSIYDTFLNVNQKTGMVEEKEIFELVDLESIKSSSSSLHDDNLFCNSEIKPNCKCLKCKEKMLQKR